LMDCLRGNAGIDLSMEVPNFYKRCVFFENGGNSLVVVPLTNRPGKSGLVFDGMEVGARHMIPEFPPTRTARSIKVLYLV
jgi:hypothetical protein